MRVTLHQPEHLPWLGYFHKMAQADMYVVMDTVQYRHRYFQNRNRIIGVQEPIWLNVPVLKQQHRYGPINEIRIDNSRDWRKTYWSSISYHYGRHPYFTHYGPDLQARLFAPEDSLCSLNLKLIDFLRTAFRIQTPMIGLSELAIEGAKGDLVLEACLAVGATTYLSGPFGRDYLDEATFTAAGVRVEYHDFEHPTYPQLGPGPFEPCLSALDALMNCGPDAAQWLHPVPVLTAPALSR